MQYGHILRGQHIVHRSLLRGIEPGHHYGAEVAVVQGRLCVDDVAQLCQPAVLGGCHAVERLEHQAVGVLIEIELNAHPLGIEHLAHGRGRRHGDDHTVVLHVTHLPHEGHVSEHL